MKRSLAERFWSKVDIRGVDECWPWLGAIGGVGYGNFRVGLKTVNTHRVAYKLKNRRIPKGKLVMHRCDYRPCCNPDHLFAGTTLDNVTDKMTKGRHRYGITYGEDAGNAKLTRSDVGKIRRSYARGTNRNQLAATFKVSWTHINRIVTYTSRIRA